MHDEQQEKTIGVVGFHFTPDLQKVTLIKKDHPEWQKGKLNGVGGKMEEKDYGNPEITMIREWTEETGIHLSGWKLHGIYTYPNYTLHVYYNVSDVKPRTVTSEEVLQIHVETLDAFKNNLVDGVEEYINAILEKLLAQ